MYYDSVFECGGVNGSYNFGQSADTKHTCLCGMIRISISLIGMSSLNLDLFYKEILTQSASRLVRG